MIYLDNGASGHPKPPSVIRAVSAWLQKNGANPGRSGHRLSMEAAEMIYNTRVKIGGLFGMNRPENVILTPGATYALNTVLLGLFQPGDHVITTDLEHNSVLRPLWQLQKNGVSVTVVRTDFESEAGTVARILNAVRPETRAIVCTQCSNAAGFMLPIERISALRPDHVRMIVDGAQGAGSQPLDVCAENIDYYCAPSHKGMMGPQGGGFILINHDAPRPLVFGGTGSETLNPEQPAALPDRLESGTLPAPICAGMLAAAEWLEKTGVDHLHRQKQELTAYAYEALRAVPGIELYMEPYAARCAGVVPFNLHGKTSGEVTDYLDAKGFCVRGGLHCAPLFHKRMGTESRGMVRISFGPFNTSRELDRLAAALKKID